MGISLIRYLFCLCTLKGSVRKGCMNFDEKYPQHAALKKVQHNSQTVGTFLAWMLKTGIRFCEPAGGGNTGFYVRISSGISDLLAQYYGIDLDKLQEEKDAIIQEMQEISALRFPSEEEKEEGNKIVEEMASKHNIEIISPDAEIPKKCDLSNLPRNVVDAMRKVVSMNPDIVFCGSLGLKLQGKLSRAINDIDIIVPMTEYDRIVPQSEEDIPYPIMQLVNFIKPGKSGQFMVDGKEVRCFGTVIEDIEVDVFVSTNKITSNKFAFFDGLINIQDADESVKYKMDFISRFPNDKDTDKHMEDLNTFTASAPDAVDDLPF